MNSVATRTGGRQHVMLSTLTLCGLSADLEGVLLPDHAREPKCMNCLLKLERLQRRNRRLNTRARARETRPRRRRERPTPNPIKK